MPAPVYVAPQMYPMQDGHFIQKNSKGFPMSIRFSGTPCPERCRSGILCMRYESWSRFWLSPSPEPRDVMTRDYS